MKHNIPSLLGCLLTAACLSYITQSKADPVTVTVDTVPGGQTINVDGTDYTAPAPFAWEPDSLHTLIAPSPQTNADGHSQQVFSAWSDGGAQTNQISTPGADTNYTASFSTQYLLDIAVTPLEGGTVSADPTGPWYSAGQQVSLTANTNPGYVFSSWSGVDSQADNTAQVTMTNYRSVGATFQDLVPITVDTVPSGLALTVDSVAYTAPATFNWIPGSNHDLGLASPQVSGDSHTQYSFSAWTDGGAQNHSITTPGSGTNYTASFGTNYLLDITISPTGAGSVSNYPAGPWYSAGQTVSLTAKTNAGYRFSFWQGADSWVTNSAQVTMNGYRLVQAVLIPFDYPYLVVANNGGAAPGSLIGNIDGRTADGTKLYYVVLDNTGTNIIFANKTNALYRFVTPQGFDASTGTNNFVLKNETITSVDTFSTVGYTVDNHDIKVLPNGHALVFGSEVRTVDMSKLYSGGKTAASVTGDILQEIDANKRVVFEWHTFDYIAITNTFADMTQSSFDYAHLNAMSIDPTDNNLLVSLRTTSEIVKINRQTGQIMWRLGGKMNQFTFIGEHATNAPYYTIGQHDIHRLPNGNLLYFDNGNIQGGGTTGHDRTYSRGVEYQLDEVHKTATLVWEFRHTPDISAGCTGQIRRYPNGNTAIGWGCAIPSSGTIMTEVSSAGNVVFEISHRNPPGSSSLLLGAGLIKQSWNTSDLIRSDSYQGIVSGQTYSSSQAGVSVTVNSLTGATNNQLVLERHLDAVRFPQFSGRAPQLVMQRVVLSGSNITALAANLSLNLPDTSSDFDTPVIHDPTQVVVYQRPTQGQGQFSALATTYDAASQTLQATITQLGELIFAYPDMDETNYVPVILSPADQSQFAYSGSGGVTLTWEPQGLVGSFDLQVGTNADFSNLVLNTNGLGVNSFALASLSAGAQYFWRVRAVGGGVAGDWATASFTPVASFIQVTYPAGGEVWMRNQNVTILWNDNISENVMMDLYLDGVSNRTFTTTSVPSTGSWTWKVAQYAAVTESTNYTIKIRSSSNPAIYGFSQPITLVNSNRLVAFASVPPGLNVTVDGTNYTTPKILTNWLPFTAHTLVTASPQVAGDGHSRYLFSAWSDGGDRSHSYTVPLTAAVTNTATFTTNYLLDMAASPPEAGSVLADPVGAWYNPGQLVSLSASVNTGYLFYDWQGVDSKTNNTAQVTLSGYKSIQAKFIPLSGVPLIDASSLVRLSNGGLQFNFTAGAGAASQATVWATPTLVPPNWQTVTNVTLSGSNGVFTETAPFTNSTRFFRVTLP